MSEPVLIVLGYRNDGIERPMPITVTQWPGGSRPASFQYADDDVIEQMDGDQTAVWLATWNAHVYDLIRPMTAVEIAHAGQDHMSEEAPF